MPRMMPEGRSGDWNVGKRRGGNDKGVRRMGRQVGKPEYERGHKEWMVARLQGSRRQREKDKPFEHPASRQSNVGYVNCIFL